MGKLVESVEDLTRDEVFGASYLFFEAPPAIWIGHDSDENHDKILADSQRAASQIVVAGVLLNGRFRIELNGQGSGTLGIPKRNSKPAVEYARGLPGVTQQHRISS